MIGRVKRPRLGLAVAQIVAISLGPALAPTYGMDARVLPQGVSQFEFIFAQSGSVTQTFNSSGVKESLTEGYRFDLDSQTLKGFHSRAGELIEYLNQTGIHYDVQNREDDAHGVTLDHSKPLLGDALSAGTLGIDAVAQERVFALTYNYGLTDWLSIGFGLPIIHAEIQVQKQMSGINTAEDIYEAVQGNFVPFQNDLYPALNTLRSLDPQTIQNAIIAAGYQPIEEYSETALGDLGIGARIRYFSYEFENAGSLLASLQPEVFLPTGKTQAPDQLVGIDFGDGAWKTALQNRINYSPWHWLTLSTSAKWTHPFAASRRYRIPRAGELLPGRDSEETVASQKGDQFKTSVGARTFFLPWLSLDMDYFWEWKLKDSIHGAQSGDAYGSLTQDTASSLQTLHAGLILSTAAIYPHGFPYPFSLSVNGFLPTRGKNTPVAPYGTIELLLYL